MQRNQLGLKAWSYPICHPKVFESQKAMTICKHEIFSQTSVSVGSTETGKKRSPTPRHLVEWYSDLMGSYHSPTTRQRNPLHCHAPWKTKQRIHNRIQGAWLQGAWLRKCNSFEMCIGFLESGCSYLHKSTPEMCPIASYRQHRQPSKATTILAT